MLARRIRSIGLLALVAIMLVALAPLWVPCSALVDLVGGRRRLPTVRLLAFAIWWAGLELAAVTLCIGAWLVGAGSSLPIHYRMQRWWAAAVLDAIRRTVGLEVDVVGVESFRPGPVVLFGRHASLIDSLITAVVIARDAGMHPRMVMKKELMADPALDIVGHRLPNVFVDRGASDSTANLQALTRLASGLGSDDVVAIFPEGTRASAERRDAALERIATSNSDRAGRLAALRWLIPPRVAGARTLLDAAPDADVVLTWHTGLDGLNTFGGILAAIGSGPLLVHYAAERVDRSAVPVDGFENWLDEQWLRMDAAVDEWMARAGSSTRT